MSKRGTLFILIGPGGSGKNTAQDLVLQRVDNLVPVRGIITRDIRPGEVADSDHVSVPYLLQQQEAGQLTAYVTINGNHYGTPKRNITGPLEQGKDAIRIFTCDGADAALDDFADEYIVTIFLDCPLEVIRERMVARGDKTEAIKGRLTLAEYEMSRKDDFMYHVDATRKPARVADDVVEIINLERSFRQGMIYGSPFLNLAPFFYRRASCRMS